VNSVHFVVPGVIDDPDQPSGGNTYDRRVCRGLAGLGWPVHEHHVADGWPRRDPNWLAALTGALEGLRDRALVLVDGLIASTAPEVFVPLGRRHRLIVLVHMPMGHGTSGDARTREHAALSAAAAIVTTSQWCRDRLLALYQLPADRVHVAEPGADVADLATGTDGGGSFLCVAAVIAEKGHDVLLEALETMLDLPWHCSCVGSLDRAPAFVEALRLRTSEVGLGGRVSFLGPLTRPHLERRYAAADLLVLASRVESYGMVITEALARGLPVLAADVGGVTEALGYAHDGARPGQLVAPDDPAALAAALRAWLTDAELRARWRRAARERRESLGTWAQTASLVADVLAGALP
jgi:glycosyltransferase involved in cell wall biosynthesis